MNAPDASTRADQIPRGSAERREFLREMRARCGQWLPRVQWAAEASPQPEQNSLDSLVGGVRPKRLVDLLAARPGCGASLIGLWLARRACQDRGELVVVDPRGAFYPPAAIGWGVDGARLLWLKPRSAREAAAAAEIALRSPAVAAVWALLGRIDGLRFRRLLHAAEAGEAFGVLVRPGHYASESSWADVQLTVEATPSWREPDAPFLTRVTQARNRHGPAGGSVLLAIDWIRATVLEVTPRHAAPDPTAIPLPLAAQLARPAGPA